MDTPTGAEHAIVANKSRSRPSPKLVFTIIGITLLVVGGFLVVFLARLSDKKLSVEAMQSQAGSCKRVDARGKCADLGTSAAAGATQVAVDKSEVSAGEGYTLTMTAGGQAYSGPLLALSQKCELTNPKICTELVTAPWYDVVDGKRAVVLAVDFPVGVYRAKFKPATDQTALWSNEIIVKVTPQKNNSLTVEPATQQVTQGQSYSLRVKKNNQPFQGEVDVESVYCSTPNSCGAAKVYTPWSGVRFNAAGEAIVANPASVPAGIYKARIRQAGQAAMPWSNEFSVTVGRFVRLRVPTKIMSPSLPTEAGGAGGNIYAPDIIFENGIYKMWYGGQAPDGSDRIHYATSQDGITWNKLGVVIDSAEATHVNDPSVVKVNGTYYMYYTDARPRASGVVLDRIYLATSTDGQSWAKQGMVLDTGTQGWNNYVVGRPSVLYEAGQWKMWFDTISLDPQYPSRYVGYATSSDGRLWSIRPEPVTTGGAVDVKKIDNKYVMLQEWQQGTLILVSNDGIAWVDKGVLFSRSGTDFDQYGQVTPFLFLSPTNGKSQAVYFGGAAIETWNHNSIGVYRLEGTDLDKYLR